MRYAFLVDSKPVSPAQAIKLSKQGNISAAIVRSKATFTDTMSGLLSYAQAYENDCCVRVVEVHIMNIVEAMKSLNFLAGNSRVTYTRYISLEKMMMVHQGMLPLLLKLGKTHRQQKLLVSHSLMTKASTFLLRRKTSP